MTHKYSKGLFFFHSLCYYTMWRTWFSRYLSENFRHSSLLIWLWIKKKTIHWFIGLIEKLIYWPSILDWGIYWLFIGLEMTANFLAWKFKSTNLVLWNKSLVICLQQKKRNTFKETIDNLQLRLMRRFYKTAQWRDNGFFNVSKILNFWTKMLRI